MKMPNLIPEVEPHEDHVFNQGGESKVDVAQLLADSFEDEDEDDFTIDGIEGEEAEAETPDEEVAEAEEPEVPDTAKDEIESRSAALEVRERALALKEQKLATAAKIENLLQYEEFRRPITEMLEQASKPGFDWGTKDGESVSRMLKDFHDPRVDELLAEMPKLREAAEALQTARAVGELESLQSRLSGEYGEVDAATFQSIAESAAKKYGQSVTLDQVELEARRSLAGKGIKATKQLEELKAQPKGTRLVTGTTARKMVKEPDIDPLKLSDSERRAQIARSL
jgi:hypothetical protein